MSRNYEGLVSKLTLLDSDRPFVCPEDGRSKRFWTAQHLKVHESMDKGEKPWKVISDLNFPLGCSLNGLSSVQERVVCVFLRNTTTSEHISTRVSPAGTKLYLCEHSDCSKSFATNRKLEAH